MGKAKRSVAQTEATVMRQTRLVACAGRLLTVAEAARALNLKEVTIRYWVGQRRLSAYRLNRSIRIPLTEIERVLEEALVPREPKKK